VKLTKQGVADLNEKPVNGHKGQAQAVCLHLVGPLMVVGRGYHTASDGYLLPRDIFGKRCLKCDEVVGPTV
jgi:hypothetical protein